MPNGEPQLTGVAIKNAAIARAPTVGQRKFLFRLSTDVLPQHSNGPTAVSNSTSNATGIMTRLKKGGPTVILCPWTQSERIGKSVPQSTAKQATTNSRLLNRKLDSRETSDSVDVRCADARDSSRRTHCRPPK